LAFFRGNFSDYLDRLQTFWTRNPGGAVVVTEADNQGSGGNPWSDAPYFEDPKDYSVSAIKTTWGVTAEKKVLVVQIQAKYGTTWGRGAGSSDGLTDFSTNLFTLEADEYIVQIKGRASNKIHALQWITNKGRASQVNGGEGGTEFTWQGDRLAFLSGTASKYLDALGAHWVVV